MSRVPVLVLVQQLRRRGRGAARRDVAAPAGDAPTASRRCESSAIWQGSPRSDFVVVSLRNATAYGVSPRLRCDVVLNNLVAWAFTTGSVRLKSDGTPWRPLVHIRDIARAFLLAPRRTARRRQWQGVQRRRDRCEPPDPRPGPHRRRGRARIARSSWLPTRRPTRATTGSTATLLARTVGFRPAWDVERGAAELYDAFR